MPAKRQEKTHSEETKQTLEPDSDMTLMLKLSDRQFKITMIKIFRTLKKKVANMQEQTGNVGRETETPRIKRKC